MPLGSAQLASVVISLKSGLRLPGFMPGAAGPTGSPRKLPVMKEGVPVPCVSIGVGYPKVGQAFVVCAMLRAES